MELPFCLLPVNGEAAACSLCTLSGFRRTGWGGRAGALEGLRASGLLVLQLIPALSLRSSELRASPWIPRWALSVGVLRGGQGQAGLPPLRQMVTGVPSEAP